MSVRYIRLLNGFTVMKARKAKKFIIRPEVKNSTAKSRWTIRDRLKARRKSPMLIQWNNVTCKGIQKVTFKSPGCPWK